MSIGLHPWWLARKRSIARLVVQSIALVALLFAVGLHGARACAVLSADLALAEAMADPCHQRAITLDPCTVHCQSDGQLPRLASFDLPALAPATAVRIEAPAPIAALESSAARYGGWQRAGPPLHILLQRFLT